MRYASVCDGIGAVHVAWQPLGWHCEWTAEIDAFPAAVVEQRWGFPNRGDMTKFTEWNDESIDLLVGGTPCQSFSVAGLRKGLHDPRGGLMLTFLEIAQRYRPRWVVWENVPGVLSSNGGRDFGAFLGALGELGYGWAYRVLDAQWFGVAQRRRRVFVVGCIGDERRAAQVLFESESVRRDNPPSRAKGQGVAAAASSGTGSGSIPDTCGTLCADKHPGAYSGQDAYTGRLVPQAFYSNEGRCDNIPPPDISPPVKIGSSGSGNPPAIAFTQNTRDEVRQINGDGQIAGALAANAGMKQTNYVAYDITGTLATNGAKQTDIHTALQGRTPGQSEASTTTVVAQGFTYSGYSNKPAWITGDRTDCLPSSGHGDTSHQGIGVMQPVAVRTAQTSANQNASGRNTPLVASFSIRADAMREGIAKTPSPDAEGRVRLRDPGLGVYEEIAPTMDTGQPHGVTTPMAVRRLTPRECERLQGFPDDYTAIDYRNKPAADGPRYKALGNSMAVPVMAWIGRRIAENE